MTADGQEILLCAHQSVSNPSTSTTLLSEIQMRHAGHVVDSVHKNHFLTIDGEKGTQSLYLRHIDETGEITYRIPFFQRAGLMTFSHRKPDPLEYRRNLPIVFVTLDHQWEPQAQYDDHGALVVSPLESTFIALSSLSHESLQQPLHHTPQSSSWHHAETYSLSQPPRDIDDEFYDVSQGTDKQLYGNVFHVSIPQHWRNTQASPTIHLLRQYHVDDFLHSLSYNELLGLLPDDPKSDS
jgi:hypothetical protein